MLACSLLPGPAQGQFTQQSPKLVGTGAIGNAAQGVSVVPSAEGNTAIVGGLDDNGGAGAAWVYTRSALPGPGWSKAREPPSPGTGDAHTASVAWILTAIQK